MIQFREDILWCADPTGRRTPFDGDRLGASIRRVAHGDWTLADEIVAAIHLHVQEQCSGGVIDSAEVAKLVVALLVKLGRDDIARAYEQRGQRATIALDAVAAEDGMELGFYQRLAGLLRQGQDGRVLLLQLSGLRACVMRLRGARRWGAGCQGLADDILGFVQAQVRQTRPLEGAGLSVEITE